MKPPLNPCDHSGGEMYQIFSSFDGYLNETDYKRVTQILRMTQMMTQTIALQI